MYPEKPKSGLELELSGGRMKEIVDQAMDRIVAHLESLPRQPAADVEGAELLARSLVEPAPESGAPFSDLLDLIFDKLVPKSYNTAGPGYLAYIPGGGIFHAALADLIANAVNRYVGVWAAAPGLAQLEANVIRWFNDMVGYPREARGILTTGGSMANFSALVTVRRARLPENFLKGVYYASDQVHHSILKAAAMAGFPEANFRIIPADSAYRIVLHELERRIDKDRSEGWIPFLIVASAGTTNTGAVDDLDRLADLAQAQRLWLHVDAAYGGFFMLTSRGQRAMRGLGRSDSVTLDPHKALFLPYGTGSLLVRDGEALKRAHTVHAEYMPPMQEDPDLVDFCLYSAELSREFRGLKVWLPLKMHGLGAFRRCLDEKLDLAAWATEELRRIPDVEILAAPQLSLVAFRWNPPGAPAESVNGLNRRLLQQINAKRRVFMTGTTLRGQFVLRICVLSFRTHIDRIEAAVDDIRTSMQELACGDASLLRNLS